MQTFDYIAVLLSIVISLAMAHLLTGIAHMIENGVRRFSIPLAMWIGFSLFMCVDYWFFVWSLHQENFWSLPYVGLLLLLASLIYISSRLIVPSGRDGEPIDMTAFFERNRRKYLAVLIVDATVNEAINLSLPGFGSLHLGLLVAAWIATYCVAWMSSSNRVQIAAAVVNAIITIHYAMIYVSSL